jgi:phosphonate transport system substrate-binding protein
MQVFTLFSKFKKALTRAILAFIATIKLEALLS